MFDCILLMAGRGSRTSLEFNKVFYQIDNKYLFEYSLNEFLKIEECRKVILVCREDEVDFVESYRSSRVLITTGGLMRQDSVSKGMELSTEEIVLIHDAARYNITSIDILNVYTSTLKYKAAVLASKVTDTIKEVKDMKAVKTLNRDLLWAMQTPQGVNRSLYLQAINKANEESYYGTDDVELLEKYLGINAVIVPGRNNFKLTTDQDIELCEIIIRSKSNV